LLTKLSLLNYSREQHKMQDSRFLFSYNLTINSKIQ
jgi:hypothetical protein